LREAGRDCAPETPLRFAEIARHPEMLERVLAEPEFAHLKAVVLTLPGAEAPDGNRPSAQIMYLRGPGHRGRLRRSAGAEGVPCADPGRTSPTVHVIQPVRRPLAQAQRGGHAPVAGGVAVDGVGSGYV
ncbi:MAG TPA: hypothetical protein PKY50_19225, partial [Candidatus Competibacter sp.]|nr:hypothetical protein [Candidatus Competibacter sp.]